jgi:hypothetical protein
MIQMRREKMTRKNMQKSPKYQEHAIVKEVKKNDRRNNKTREITLP